MITSKNLGYRSVPLLNIGYPAIKPVPPRAVFERRLTRLLAAMTQRGLDAVVIYADREHYFNFKYYTGFDPRFEEAVLFIHRDGRAYAALGNECLNLAQLSRIPLQAVLCQFLSLPNQPMESFVSLEETVKECGLRAGMRVGMVDWKLITPRHGADYRHLYAAPSFLTEAVIAVVGGREAVTNETAMLVEAPDGLRCCAGAADIAELEFGAACASQSVIDMLSAARPGTSEREIAAHIRSYGQPVTCHDYVVAGANARRGLISPSDYVLQLGDEFTTSVGLQGGLTCRSCMVAYDHADVRFDGEHYIEEVIKPYMAAVFNWYEMLHVGACCGDIYNMVSQAIPRDKFGWYLNPGHLTNYEEWMSSPMFVGSQADIRSGMIFQMDIIPSDPVYRAPNAEDGVVVADEALRAELAADYPEVYERIQRRRQYAQSVIGLKLSPDVLPLSNCFAAYSPYCLRPDRIIVKN